MKKINFKKKAKYLFASLIVLGQVVSSTILPVIANAGVIFPKEVTVEYDNNRMYVTKGTNSDGSAFDERIPPLYAVYEGKRQPIFCIEPAVPILNSVTPGYTSNPLPTFANDKRSKFLTVLWKYAGNDEDTQQVAQIMLWEHQYGKTIDYLRRPDGSLIDVAVVKAKINQIITDYEKQPSFNNQKVTVKVGESVTLTDTNNSGLSRFDNAVLNSANVDYSIDGNKLTITPKKDSKEDGTLMLAKSMDEGTPVAYSLAGSQQVMAGAIDDPNKFKVILDVIKTGDIKVTKLDEGTGEPVPNTEFDMKNLSDGKTQKVKTDAKGEGLLKDVYDGTEVEITETFVPAPYIKAKNNTKKITVKAGQVTPVEFRNERATGKSTLTKVDKTTESDKPLNPNYPMTGAKYGWFKEDGKLVKEFTLDKNQTATIEGQPLATYYWKETVAPVGYALDPEKHVVELTYKDQDTPVVIKDSKSNDDVIRMNLDGQKLIQNETNEMFKNDVEFTLTNKRTGETHVVKTATVDGKKGYFNFSDIALDDYVLTETKGVEGYKNVDPIEITHSFDKETKTFTFVIKDQKSGNVLNEETFTQLELSKGENVDLGTYTLKDKAEVVEKPEVGISTQAHTGDGKTQTFEWGEDVKFYDDVTITTRNIPKGTVLVYETIQVAVYPDGTIKDVWTSGKVDLKMTDEKMTERVLSEYDYKKDPKGTRYYFKELVHKPVEEKHNFDGKEKTQDITPVTKETPKTPETPKETPKGSLPYTGEQMMRGATVVGLLLIAGVAGAMFLKRKKTNEETEKTTEENE
ncbi:peptidase [Enterococcus plantarum]|uniref:Peptidase n=1 Tax=Enterococcus plantarum TaxID=1077675 RepID=A0A2W3Z4C9_9ENTE|nr:LPXTG cell wall anchor domain-containing protein [Enterococcus plantarum]PZL72170.1 peptidase [Enterococcus plantarum]